MLFLDANAFYWYFGRDKLGIHSEAQINENALCDFLNSHEKKSVPFSVLLEVFTHFRSSPNKLKDIINFIIIKNIKIHNNIPFLKGEHEALKYIPLMDDMGIKFYAEKLLKEKIKIEASFAVTFFEVVRLLYLQYAQEKYKLNDNQYNVCFKFLGKECAKENRKKYKQKFELALQEGYLRNKEEKELKNAYIKALNDECLNINLFLQLLVNYEDKNINLIDVLQNEYQRLSVSDFFETLDNNATMKTIAKEIQNNVDFFNYSASRISNIFKKKGFSCFECRYIETMLLPSWLINSQKYKKNDILDMFCLKALDFCETSTIAVIDTTSYLISFDDKVKEFLHKEHLKSWNLIDQFIV